MSEPGPFSEENLLEEVLSRSDRGVRDGLLVALAADRGRSPREIAALSGIDREEVERWIDELDLECPPGNDGQSDPEAVEPTIRRLMRAETDDRIAEILQAVAETRFGATGVIVHRYDGVENELVPELVSVDGEPDVGTIDEGDDPRWSAFRDDVARTVGDELVVAVQALGIVRFLGVDPDVIGDAEVAFVRPIAAVALGTLERRRRIQRLEADRHELAAENERLEEFASIVSHDLRNPLSVARGHLELAADTGAEEHFEKVEEAHDRIERIIEHTLSVASEGHRTEDTAAVDLASVAREAWETVDTDAATLAIEGSLQLEADPERLRQLLENLFRNAVEHGSTSSDSQTRENDEQDSTGNVTVTVGALEDGTGFFVADDGPGIPEAERPRLFERGYTSQDDGTGYGLYIVAEIVDGHRWNVAVTDSEDGGARFEFSGCRSG